MAHSKDIFRQFQTPDDEFLPPVMWFWNDKLEEEEIAFQIAAFKASGISAFFVHPLWGMEEEYLSERFFELIRYAVAEAKKHSMYFWIYDEYNWPSGMAGGYLIRDEPWTRSTVLKAHRVDLFAGQPANTVFRGQFVSAQIIYGNKSPRISEVSSQIVVRTEGDLSYISYSNKSCVHSTLWVYYRDFTRGMTTVGMWSSFSWFQEGYVDANNPDAVRRFMDLTHERYKAAIGEEFGQTVKGIFTDEVNNMSLFDHESGVTPWTENLPDEFQSEHGYDLLPKLYALHCGFIDQEVMKVRYDYWRTCARLFKSAYMQQIADWSSKHQLLLTGHLSGENSIHWHSFQMGDFFDSNTPFHIPGIDSILSTQFIDDPAYSLETKLIASVAKFNGRSRVMCETFSGSGWEMKLGDAKRIMNRLMVHGINMIVYMGAYYSLDGARKRLPLGYPPSHGYNNPLFEHYDMLNTYAARIQYLSSITQPAGRVLVMIPQTSHYINTHEAEKLDFAWHGVAEALIRLHIEFDFGFEPLAPEMNVADGILEIRGYQYDTVIVPEMTYTTEAVAKALEQMIVQGGRVIFVNALITAAADKGIFLDFASLCGFAPNAAARAMAEAAASDKPRVVRLDGKATFLAAPNLKANLVRSMMGVLANLLEKERQPFHLLGEQEGIYTGHRVGDAMELIFLDNDHPEEKVVKVEVGMAGRLLLLNPDAGQQQELQTVVEGNRRRFELAIAGNHLVVVVCMHDEERQEAEAVASLPMPPMSTTPTAPVDPALSIQLLEGGWSFEAEGGNWLPLRLKLASDSAGIVQLAREGNGKALHETAAVPNAVTESASGELPGGYGVNQGDAYAAIAYFQVDDIPEVLELIAELEDGMAVYVNGVELNGWQKVRLWGIRNARADIISLVKKGMNIVVIVTRVPEWGGPHAIPSAMLRGAFSVDGDDCLQVPPQTIAADYWTRQGFRYYSGNGTYTASFELEEFKQVRVCIPTTDVVRVAVNGEEAARLPWPPYEADITCFCRPGNNELRLSFTSTYKSLMDIENVRLLGQGVTIYEENREIVESGLGSAPWLLIER